MVQLAVLRKVIRNGILTVPFWLALRVKHILHSYTPSSRQPWQTFFGKRLCETFLKTSLPSLFFRRETEMWDSSPSQWAKHLSAYPDSVKTRELSENKSDLISLDDFVWSELGAQVNSASRSPPHITSAEYVRIVRWKLKRGKWRPRLQSMADAVDNNEVVAASTKAFAALKKGNLRDALKPFTELKGCGPATASAILAAVDVQVPFMSDELLQEVMGEHKYTVPVSCRLSLGCLYFRCSYMNTNLFFHPLDCAGLCAACEKSEGESGTTIGCGQRSKMDCEGRRTSRVCSATQRGTGRSS